MDPEGLILISNQLWLHGPNWPCSATEMDESSLHFTKGVYVRVEGEGQVAVPRNSHLTFITWEAIATVREKCIC